ncbi:cytochrome-c peroxidase [Marinobacterium rhizophilum]|uniref:cytochrome-c peroxidase n=1 Tax=Marinobacterium rhizophilum TaxID=420402 RepID=UPI00037D64FC|nr:cytochrome-c peroxidase [Marinobacterium rhizophilum]
MPMRSLSCSLALLLLLPTPLSASPRHEPITPISPIRTADPARTELGKQLFHDVRLSADNSVACVSCHDLSRGGADSRAHSLGIGGKPTAVNTPTVFNAALNFRQFWNGRADSLEAQIDAVIENPDEMGSKWPDVVAKLVQDANYKAAFSLAYPDGVTQANIRNAIATFERTLLTPDSPFDRYLLGDADAISADEKAGYLKFKQYGCVACHQGVNIGGNMYQKFGVMGDYFKQRGNPTDADLGRFLVTRNEEDRHVFKVPSLRNVALTAPYFHDASARTLKDAVDVMFRYQLGRAASQEDKASIIRFLKTLTGELRGSLQ